MRVGLQLPSFDWPGGSLELAARLTSIARTAEDAGFASLWVMDHYFQLPDWGEVDSYMLEAYTTLGYLAAVTRRIHLGALVTGVVYRFPGILVKISSTLDVLAGGRTYLALGAAWYGREARGLGVPFPPLAERFERLEEALQITRQMWSGDAHPYTGKHFQLPEPINSPQPLARPHPPIMIGGNGEQKTLRLVARYGDACNFLVLEPEEIRGKVAVLQRHCEAIGRPFEEIERTALDEIQPGAGKMAAADIIGRLHRLADAGVQHVIVNMPNAHELWPLEVFGREIIPAVASLRGGSLGM